ncbi:hypothetical protein PR048_024856 [Dryococelus australis]|uniref:Uncharacterized protein n=1 Tax=Dryococelus australis TaxID=614101 RepID=A0ABQ9GPR5_9NEOP|nr:hypothetical protein PR048_024856 [Dryococelus australis]
MSSFLRNYSNVFNLCACQSRMQDNVSKAGLTTIRFMCQSPVRPSVGHVIFNQSQGNFFFYPSIRETYLKLELSTDGWMGHSLVISFLEHGCRKLVLLGGNTENLLTRRINGRRMVVSKAELYRSYKEDSPKISGPPSLFELLKGAEVKFQEGGMAVLHGIKLLIPSFLLLEGYSPHPHPPRHHFLALAPQYVRPPRCLLLPGEIMKLPPEGLERSDEGRGGGGGVWTATTLVGATYDSRAAGDAKEAQRERKRERVSFKREGRGVMAAGDIIPPRHASPPLTGFLSTPFRSSSATSSVRIQLDCRLSTASPPGFHVHVSVCARVVTREERRDLQRITAGSTNLSGIVTTSLNEGIASDTGLQADSLNRSEDYTTLTARCEMTAKRREAASVISENQVCGLRASERWRVRLAGATTELDANNEEELKHVEHRLFCYEDNYHKFITTSAQDSRLETYTLEENGIPFLANSDMHFWHLVTHYWPRVGCNTTWGQLVGCSPQPPGRESNEVRTVWRRRDQCHEPLFTVEWNTSPNERKLSDNARSPSWCSLRTPFSSRMMPGIQGRLCNHAIKSRGPRRSLNWSSTTNPPTSVFPVRNTTCIQGIVLGINLTGGIRIAVSVTIHEIRLYNLIANHPTPDVNSPLTLMVHLSKPPWVIDGSIIYVHRIHLALVGERRFLGKMNTRKNVCVGVNLMLCPLKELCAVLESIPVQFLVYVYMLGMERMTLKNAICTRFRSANFDFKLACADLCINCYNSENSNVSSATSVKLDSQLGVSARFTSPLHQLLNVNSILYCAIQHNRAAGITKRVTWDFSVRPVKRPLLRESFPRQSVAHLSSEKPSRARYCGGTTVDIPYINATIQHCNESSGFNNTARDLANMVSIIRAQYNSSLGKLHYLPKSNWAPLHNVCSVFVTPLEYRRATSCGYNNSHPVWHAFYEYLQDIHGDSSPFLLQPFHELNNDFSPRLTSPHPAIQLVPKMFYRFEVGALGGYKNIPDVNDDIQSGTSMKFDFGVFIGNISKYSSTFVYEYENNVHVFNEIPGIQFPCGGNRSEMNMEQHRNEKAVGTGDPREYPPTRGIVRHYPPMQKSVNDPGGEAYQVRFERRVQIVVNKTVGMVYSAKQSAKNLICTKISVKKKYRMSGNAATNLSVIRHTARERAEISSAEEALEFTCSEYWDMTMAMGASGGQASCMLHAYNVRKTMGSSANTVEEGAVVTKFYIEQCSKLQSVVWKCENLNEAKRRWRTEFVGNCVRCEERTVQHEENGNWRWKFENCVTHIYTFPEKSKTIWQASRESGVGKIKRPSHFIASQGKATLLHVMDEYDPNRSIES